MVVVTSKFTDVRAARELLISHSGSLDCKIFTRCPGFNCVSDSREKQKIQITLFQGLVSFNLCGVQPLYEDMDAL